MTSQLASGDLISDRYASALYDLASEKKLLDPILKNLKKIKETILDNKELLILIKSPLISSDNKLDIILKIMSSQNLDKITVTFLKVISNNKRFSSLLSIISVFFSINAHRRGDVLADIMSADPLSSEQEINIKNQLKKILGDKLLLNFKVDKKIIGGLIVKVGSKMIDTSLANKINKLKIAMKGA